MADRITEDDPRWNPMTMGNRRYGGGRGYETAAVSADQIPEYLRERFGRGLMRRRPTNKEGVFYALLEAMGL